MSDKDREIILQLERRVSELLHILNLFATNMVRAPFKQAEITEKLRNDIRDLMEGERP